MKKKTKIVEDHHDDCGEDLSSLDDVGSFYCDLDTDDELLEQVYDFRVVRDSICGSQSAEAGVRDHRR